MADSLYRNPVAIGTDNADNSRGDGGSPSGNGRTGGDGEPKTRKPRSDAGTPRSRNTPGKAGIKVSANVAPTDGYKYTSAQLDDLSLGLARFLQMAARGPAMMRSNQWGADQIPDPVHGGTKLQWRGEHWLVSDEEAREFGTAWANVIRWYAPPEAVGKGAAWTTAIGASLTIVVPRAMTDMEMANRIKQAARAEAEQHLRDSQQPTSIFPPTEAGAPPAQTSEAAE